MCIRDRHEDPEVPLAYCYYRPEEADAHKVPLLIWLHGAGEGGKEPLIAATGNKVVNLISPEIQKLFGGCLLYTSPRRYPCKTPELPGKVRYILKTASGGNLADTFICPRQHPFGFFNPFINNIIGQ